MRVGIRERYKIQVSGAKTSESRGSCCYLLLDGVMSVSQQGSVCEDWTTVYCCYPLAVCQMIREMKCRMKTQTYHVATTLQCSWKHSRRRTRRLLRKVSWDIKPVLQGAELTVLLFFDFFLKKKRFLFQLGFFRCLRHLALFITAVSTESIFLKKTNPAAPISHHSVNEWTPSRSSNFHNLVLAFQTLMCSR